MFESYPSITVGAAKHVLVKTASPSVQLRATDRSPSPNALLFTPVLANPVVDVDKHSLTFTESASSASFTLRLRARPTDTVVVTVASSDAGRAVLKTASDPTPAGLISVTFTSSK